MTCYCAHGTRKHTNRHGACSACYCPKYQKRTLTEAPVVTFDEHGFGHTRDAGTGAYL